MPRYKCTVEYEGSAFAGWQRQENSPSVQQSIEEAIEKFCGEGVRIHTAGRTDAGVHAIALAIHFDLEKEYPAEKVMGAINFHVRPGKIAINRCEIVSEEFHARHCAIKRYYVYRIVNRRTPLVLDEGRAWFVPVALDVDKMRKAASYMIGKHDFTSLRDSECQAKSPIKTIDEIRIEQNGELIEVYVSAKSFLHHMVRNIVGTLKFVGDGKWQPEYIEEILEAKDRSKAGPTAPACGLYFIKVDY
ncbi:MAG: tRNA pseudouridine(38-40) synthase TruA [Rickettsiaceae bacterium]|jgi:tRNA pseudouridine38-40 synthase|nr:tRNA pseudouridine(38-40) synthase TruA [Rickettsiaceae bacterium]